MTLIIQLYQNVQSRIDRISFVLTRRYSITRLNVSGNGLFVGRFVPLSKKFELLQLLTLLSRLKGNGIRSRKRFGLLLKLIPTSIGFDRISHSLVQRLFTFDNVSFVKWLKKTSLLQLQIIPFLEKCIIASPPELISGYSLPLIRLGIRSKVFKTRLCTATIDYGTHFPLNQILHSICYLHWDKPNTLEPVISLANLINDVELILNNDFFSVGNLVMWLKELGIRHDPLLEHLERFMLESFSSNSAITSGAVLTSSAATNESNSREKASNEIAFNEKFLTRDAATNEKATNEKATNEVEQESASDVITNNDYIRLRLMESGECLMPGDAYVSYRQPLLEDRNVSFKKVGNCYFWYRGRFKKPRLLPIGMDRISSVDLCKIVVFGQFYTNNLLEAVVYDYGLGKRAFSRSYHGVSGDLYGQFIFVLAKHVKIPRETAGYYVDVALSKFRTASIKGREAMVEASFYMGFSVWHKWLIFANFTDLNLKSKAYIALMLGVDSSNSLMNLPLKLNLGSFGSLSFTALTSQPYDVADFYGKNVKFRRLLTPDSTTSTPVYDRSTLKNYKWIKSKSGGKVSFDSDNPVVGGKTTVPFTNNNNDASPMLKTSEAILLAIVNRILLGSPKISNQRLLDIISYIAKLRRYFSTPYTKIDSNYTLWTSRPNSKYINRITNKLGKIPSESVDPRFTVLQSDNSSEMPSREMTSKKVDPFERSESNRLLDRPFPQQPRLEYFEEYLYRLSKEGALLFETSSCKIDKTSSLEDNVYQTLLSIIANDVQDISSLGAHSLNANVSSLNATNEIATNEIASNERIASNEKFLTRDAASNEIASNEITPYTKDPLGRIVKRQVLAALFTIDIVIIN